MKTTTHEVDSIKPVVERKPVIDTSEIPQAGRAVIVRIAELVGASIGDLAVEKEIFDDWGETADMIIDVLGIKDAGLFLETWGLDGREALVAIPIDLHRRIVEPIRASLLREALSSGDQGMSEHREAGNRRRRKLAEYRNAFIIEAVESRLAGHREIGETSPSPSC